MIKLSPALCLHLCWCRVHATEALHSAHSAVVQRTLPKRLWVDAPVRGLEAASKGCA